MNPIQSIAVIGATGMLGKPVTEELLNAGFQICAIARNPEKARRVMLAGNQITQSWWIGAHDYGKQVARSFQILDGEDKKYPIQEPVPYSFEEAADVFIEHYAPKQLKKMKAPLGIFKYLGWFSDQMDYQHNILYAINRYDEQFQSEQTWQELGKPQTSLAAFAESLGE